MIRKSTKEILAESFLELAADKRIDKITITEITNNCGMSQPTFYHHFKDKYDLIAWLYANDAKKIMSQIGSNGYVWRDTLRDAANYYSQNRHFVLNALRHTSGHDAFLFHVQKINTDFLVAEVRKKLMTEHIPHEVLGMIKVYCYGTVNFMLEWLLGDMELTNEQVIHIWENSLPAPLRQYLYNE